MSAPLLCFERVTYSYPGAETPALSDVSIEIGPGEFCLLAGLSGNGKSTLLRAACGLVPHFHGGHFAGRVTLAGLDTREHGPARLGALAGVLFQDPETQLVMSTRARRAGARAGEPRPRRRGGRARSRGGRARARHRRAAGSLHARALRRGEAASRARRGARGQTAAGVARRAHLAARPGRRRRADRPAAPAQPGVGDDDRARRASARALPVLRRSRDRARAWARGLRQRPAGVPRVGRASARRRCRRRPPSCSHSRASARTGGRATGPRDAARARPASR